jgi:predicted RecA/RadA family phage recombinase
MAIMDNAAVFSGSVSAAGALTGQAVSGTDTSVLATNVYDTTGATGAAQAQDIAKGEKLDIVTNVLVAASGGTSVEIQYVSADNTALSTNLTVLGSSGAIPVASLAVNKQVSFPIAAADPRAIRRYIGVRYVTVGAVAAGTYFTSLQHRHGDLPQPAYNSGFSIS